MKKKTNNPRSSLTANLLGEKASRQMTDAKAEELIRAVTVNRNSIRRLN